MMFDPWSLESAVILLTAADLLDRECRECGGKLEDEGNGVWRCRGCGNRRGSWP